MLKRQTNRWFYSIIDTSRMSSLTLIQFRLFVDCVFISFFFYQFFCHWSHTRAIAGLLSKHEQLLETATCFFSLFILFPFWKSEVQIGKYSLSLINIKIKILFYGFFLLVIVVGLNCYCDYCLVGRDPCIS